MKRTKLLIAALLLLAMPVGWAVTSLSPAAAQEKAAQDKPTPREQDFALKRFMRAKLDASSKILEGLAVEDYKLIEAGAKRLHAMSAAEEWRVSNDALYRQHSGEFRRIAQQLQEKAQKKDLDGAALAWVAATMNCVECHRWVRAQIIAEAR